MSITRIAPAAAAALAAFACGTSPDLDPSPRAQPASQAGEAFVDVENGVRVVAEIEAWNGQPADLEDRVTPVLITVENNAAEPIRLRYDLFELDNDADVDLPALPPYHPGPDIVPIEVMVYTPRGFLIAPHLRAFYPQLEPFDEPPAAHDRIGMFPAGQLPTPDMLARALPEGVLMPGGQVQGFVYFRRVTDLPTSVDLTLDLTTPTGASLGTIEIPFLVDH